MDFIHLLNYCVILHKITILYLILKPYYRNTYLLSTSV